MYKIICKKRILITMFGFYIVLFLLVYRMYDLCTDEKLKVIANSQYTYKENTCDLNYNLLDCNNNNLLKYAKSYYAVIDIKFYNNFNSDTDKNNMSKLLYILRNYDEDYDLSKTTITSGQKIYWKIDEITYNKLRNIEGIKDIKGFYTYSSEEVINKNLWNIESMIINERKIVDQSLKNENSIEMEIFNKTKNNVKPQIQFNIDVDGKISENNEKFLYDKNVNVRLTLDKKVQEDIKGVITSDKYKKYSQIGVILMESKTGKIKAMVQKDDTQPNVNLGVATNNGYFPGSIFKVLVEEAALENKIISPNEEFTCRGKYEKDNHKNHGTLKLKNALAVSCNDIFAQIGMKTGFDNIQNIVKKQNILSKNLNFDEELSGKLEIEQPKVSDGTLSLYSIGQNLRITPIEAINIINTVVNEGVYVKPYIIDAYVDINNNVIEDNKMHSEKVISKYNANILKSHLTEVVNSGTGTAALIKGIQMGGKTGSTERVEFTDGKRAYNSDGWFIGYFNVDGKYYSVVVFTKDIDKNSENGGNTSAPVFEEIIKKVSKYL